MNYHSIIYLNIILNIRVFQRKTVLKNRISKLIGLSIPTVNRYFDRLHYLGFIRPDRNGWQLSPKSKTEIRHKIKVSDKTTLSDLKARLYLKILQQKGNNQALLQFIESIYNERKAK